MSKYTFDITKFENSLIQIVVHEYLNDDCLGAVAISSIIFPCKGVEILIKKLQESIDASEENFVISDISINKYEEIIEKLRSLPYKEHQDYSLPAFVESYDKFVKIQDVINIIYTFVETCGIKAKVKVEK